jgi:hypothetical protein
VFHQGTTIPEFLDIAHTIVEDTPWRSSAYIFLPSSQHRLHHPEGKTVETSLEA